MYGSGIAYSKTRTKKLASLCMPALFAKEEALPAPRIDAAMERTR
jgi:hypothetical protein